MRRSIESSQRRLRQVNVIASADGSTLSGLDALQCTLTDTGTGDKLITLNEGFASDDLVVQVSVATADAVAQIGTITASSVQILTFDATDGTTAKDAIVHVTIIGSDVQDRY